VKVFLMQEMPKLEQQKEVLFTINDKMGFCGIAGLYSTDKANNKTELVIWISKRAKTVQNYTEITDSMLKFGFNEMLFNRIQCKTLSNDFTTAGVLKKIGFKAEGNEKAGLLTSDKTFVDLSIYAILKNEYIAHAKFAVRASKMFQRKHKRDLIK
jgi:ribosomal-protein-serine acetyltransferase